MNSTNTGLSVGAVVLVLIAFSISLYCRIRMLRMCCKMQKEQVEEPNYPVNEGAIPMPAPPARGGPAPPLHQEPYYTSSSAHPITVPPAHIERNYSSGQAQHSPSAHMEDYYSSGPPQHYPSGHNMDDYYSSGPPQHYPSAPQEPYYSSGPAQPYPSTHQDPYYSSEPARLVPRAHFSSRSEKY